MEKSSQALEPQSEELLELRPDFPSRALELIHRTLKLDSLIEDLTDGPRNRGLEVGDG